MGGFVFHSFVEFVLSCIPFFFLLVSGPSREGCQFTCLSLRRVALLWSCHITCWVEPADNLKPGTRGPGSWRESLLFSRSSCSSVKLCRLSLTIFISPHRPFFPSCLFPSLFARPYSRTQWHLMPSRTRARAKGPILFSHLFLSFFSPLWHIVYISQHLRHNRTLWIWYWLDYICLCYRCRCCYCCFCGLYYSLFSSFRPSNT